MEFLLQQSYDIIMQWNIYYLYLFLFASAIIENLFPPIPGDTIIAFGAFLAGIGKLDFLIVFIITSIGSTIGFMMLFYVGVLFERGFFSKTKIKFFASGNIKKAEMWFNKYGYFVVAINRFLPGIRSVISISAGISGLNSLKVFLLSFVSAMFWNFLWIYAGYSLGNNWEKVYEALTVLVTRYNIAAITVLAVGVIVYVLYKVVKERND
ncbi:MAG: DedA family protein [Spirochaetes bacterium]|nr:DedA family protein [Spirochaetota bacterium]